MFLYFLFVLQILQDFVRKWLVKQKNFNTATTKYNRPFFLLLTKCARTLNSLFCIPHFLRNLEESSFTCENSTSPAILILTKQYKEKVCESSLLTFPAFLLRSDNQTLMQRVQIFVQFFHI